MGEGHAIVGKPRSTAVPVTGVPAGGPGSASAQQGRPPRLAVWLGWAVAASCLAGWALPAQTNAPLAEPRQDTYQLMPQDKLRFRIEEDPVKSTEPAELLVTALGEVSFPVSRGFDTAITLSVLGKTLEQVKTELKARLDADYYQDAHCSLQLVIQSQRTAQVQYFGAVRGVVKIQSGEKKTVTDGLFELTVDDYADLRRVTINRLDPVTKKAQYLKVNVQKVLEGDRTQDVVLQDGDRVEVPQKTFLFR